MKKTLISSLILAFTVVPALAFAQTVPTTTDDISALKTELISLLTQEISVLQGQLNDMLAQEKVNTDAITTLTNKVNQPVLGSPIVPPAPVVTASLSDSQCLPYKDGTNRPTVVLNVSGASWKQANFQYPVTYVLQNNEPVLNQPQINNGAQLGPDDNSIHFPNLDYTYKITGSVYSDYPYSDAQRAYLKIADVNQTITTTHCQ